MTKEITIKKIEVPAAGSLDDDIDYVCKSFGYFTERDKQDTAGRIFQLLVKEACGSQKGMTSDEIAERLNLTRGAIVHHLNNFISTGLVIHSHKTYKLRAQSLQKSIEEIKEDIDRIITQILKIASEIDMKLGNLYR
ncbi:MAG: helix-turn-helix domain-containing protein [Candidatus Thermoplasmatota archaeon]|jgi:predicted transcriptional regulator|nr:helix-turn-helix domain-containing protein [Candidatus Thermoplasmatota archaeon]